MTASYKGSILPGLSHFAVGTGNGAESFSLGNADKAMEKLIFAYFRRGRNIQFKAISTLSRG